jgi:hypothetical protein
MNEMVRIAMKTIISGVALVAAASIAAPLYAQSYPTKPIRMVVPSAPGSGPDLIQADLSQGVPEITGMFDAVIIPNLLCYLTSAQADAALIGLRPHLKPGCELFVRTRAIDDYRYGRGVEEEPDGYRLATPETGEAGLFNLFYSPAGLVERLTRTVSLEEPTVLTCRFDNVQAGRPVPNNSDVIVWGRCG